MKVIIVAALLIVSFNINAQKNTDSLYKALENASGSQKADLLIRIGKAQNRASNLTKAFEHFQEALKIYSEEKRDDGRAQALIGISETYIRQGRFDDAFPFDSIALSLAQKTNDKPAMAAAYNNMSRFYAEKGQVQQAINITKKGIEIYREANMMSNNVDLYNRLGLYNRLLAKYDESLKYYHQGIAVAKQFNDEAGLALIYMNEASVWMTKGNYPRSLDLHLQSLKLKERMNDKRGMQQSYVNIANVYSALKRLDETLDFLKRAESLRQYNPNQQTLALIYNNMGNVFARKKYFDSATAYYSQAIAIREKLKDKAGLALSYNNMGRALTDVGKYDVAPEYFLKAEQLYKETNRKDELGSVYHNLGFLYSNLKDYDKAEDFLLKSLDIYKRSGSAKRKEPLLTISRLYEATDELEKASLYRNELLSLGDSIDNTEVHLQLDKLQNEFELERKQHQLSLQEKDNQLKSLELDKARQRVWWLGSGFALSLLAAGFYFQNFRTKKKAAIALAEKNERIETLIRELHHRVKNNLQLISSLFSLQAIKTNDESARTAIKEGQARVEAMTIIHQKLYLDDNLRTVNMEEYLQSLTYTLAGSYGYNSSVVRPKVLLNNKQLDIDIALPLGLIINELVSNAFKYAFKDVVEPQLEVVLQQQHNGVRLTVQDNGKGMDVNAVNRPGSFGLKLVNTLSRQLNATLEVQNTNGTRFNILING